MTAPGQRPGLARTTLELGLGLVAVSVGLGVLVDPQLDGLGLPANGLAGLGTWLLVLAGRQAARCRRLRMVRVAEQVAATGLLAIALLLGYSAWILWTGGSPDAHHAPVGGMYAAGLGAGAVAVWFRKPGGFVAGMFVLTLGYLAGLGALVLWSWGVRWGLPDLPAGSPADSGEAPEAMVDRETGRADPSAVVPPPEVGVDR